MANAEAIRQFDCLGSECGAWVIGASGAGDAEEGAEMVERCLRRWHLQFSRFSPESELSRLNDDPAESVAVSPMMARFVRSALAAATLTDGLVDPTLLSEIQEAGYRADLGPAIELEEALRRAPARVPASPHRQRRWQQVCVSARSITRPRGVRLDSGGIAKGMFADLLGEVLAAAQSYAVDCGGDLRIGGAASLPRRVEVLAPTGQRVLHVFEVREGALATSGIGKRSWLNDAGAPAHHLLDPATGRPAYTGIVQATALAPTAGEAEARSKAALLAGPEHAAGWLPFGGVLVFDDLTHVIHEPPAAEVAIDQPSGIDQRAAMQ